jgi:hypothetical protein
MEIDSVQTNSLEVNGKPVSGGSNPNLLINGDFDIWQRGTSQVNVNGYGSDDRWLNAYVGPSTTCSQQSFTLGQTDVPNDPAYYSRTVVTLDAAADNFYVLKAQKIESVKTLSGKTVTLSFWAKANASKNLATEFVQNFGGGGSPSSSVTAIGVTTHSLTTSWQKFTVTVDIPSISGKTLGTSNNDYLQLAFWFFGGANYNSRSNSIGYQGGTFDIAQVKLEEGSVATPFIPRSIGEELALCQRYFQKQELISASSNDYWRCPFGNSLAFQKITFNNPMRANPTITFDDSGADFEYYSYSSPTWKDVSSGPSTSKVRNNQFWIFFGVESGQDGSNILCRENAGVDTFWEADAEL